MARVLCIPSGVGFAHVGRLLLLGRELRARGHDVRFAYGGPFAAAIERDGFPWRPVRELDDASFGTPVLTAYTGAFGAACVEDEIEAIEAAAADIVIGDLRPTAWISARATGRPFVSVKNAQMCADFDFAALFEAGEKPGRWRRTARLLAGALVPIRARAAGSGLVRVASHFGQPGARSLYDFFRGDLDLICDLPRFALLRENLPDRQVVGPMIWDGGPVASEPLVVPASRRGRVYASLGNTGSPDLLRVALRAFSDVPGIRVVGTTGTYHAPDDFDVPPNAELHRVLAGAAAIRSCEVAIHCGGDGTTYQCLRERCPSVVVPFNNDQRVKAYLVQRAGLGIAMLATPLRADTLRLAVKTALARREIANRLSELAHEEWEGARGAAGAIGRWLGCPGTSAGSSSGGGR